MAWVPLESNPDVMNKVGIEGKALEAGAIVLGVGPFIVHFAALHAAVKKMYRDYVYYEYLSNLGVPEDWRMVDVYGLDPDLLLTVPRPVLAVMLLFPTDEKYDEFFKKQEGEVSSSGQIVSEKIFFLKQTIGNSCGTIALIHSVANNSEKINLADGHLKAFLDEAKPLDPEERGQLLLNADGIANTHQELAQEGQSEAPDASQPVNFHFIAFVHCDGGLYELDGRKAFPIRHGNTSPDSLLEDAAVVCRDYMERDPENLLFTVVALAANN